MLPVVSRKALLTAPPLPPPPRRRPGVEPSPPPRSYAPSGSAPACGRAAFAGPARRGPRTGPIRPPGHGPASVRAVPGYL